MIPLPTAEIATPARLYAAAAARARFDRVTAAAAAVATGGLRVVCGYSVKTNPRAELLAEARAHGWFAETISPDERRWVGAHGFGPERTIYNGPWPAYRRAIGEPLAFVFADGIAAFARDAAAGVAQLCGVRLRPAMLTSRFGVALDEDDALAVAVAHAALAGIGVSFHARREDFHGATWREVADDAVRRAARLERAAATPIVAFDVGGGWTPSEFDANAQDDLRWLVGELGRALPHVRTLIVEPGQATVTPSEALVTSVLEVRNHGARREAIVDAGYPEWPSMHGYRHRLFGAVDGAWVPLRTGGDRLGGRTCLEYDLIDGIALPTGLRAGDRLLIADVGSYDRSMAFAFARGEAPASFSMPAARADFA